MEAVDLILLFLSALFGGLAVFQFKIGDAARLKLVLSFSGAYLFAITILHLIPGVYSSDSGHIGLFILGGFILQVLMEQFSEGIEHGHIHRHHDGKIAFPLGIMLSLSLHAFLEGMPIAQGRNRELVYGIALHHIPAAFALGSVLLHNGIGRAKTIVFLIIFAVMSPLGYITSFKLAEGAISNLSAYYDQIMAVVIGIFLHISTTILFESSVDHKFNTRKFIAVIMGIAIALVGYFTNH